MTPVRDEARLERRAQQLAQQWAALRSARRAAEQQPSTIPTGPSNLSRAQVPWGLDLAAAWSWRLISISITVLGLLWLFRFFALITVPLAIALLVAALFTPFVNALRRVGVPRGPGSGIVLVLGLAVLTLLLSFVGQQVAEGADDLAGQVVEGLEQVRDWMRTGPLNLTEGQLDRLIEQTQAAITNRGEDGGLMSRVTEVSTLVGTGVAGFFILLFGAYFFLADGQRIWAWLVRLAPRAARERIDESGRVAWISLTQFVKATVLVALADALGVMFFAAVLGVPFVMAIGVLVFLGAFVPMIGATVAGSVAVLVALVDQGPVTALLMLGGVVLVQQVEGNLLQPLLMGRFVSLHPLAVIVAIGCGVITAGIVGALIAVPLAAAANAVVQHLASAEIGEDDPHEELEEDLATDDVPSRPFPPDDSPIAPTDVHKPLEDRP